MLHPEQIARVIHEAQRALAVILGEAEIAPEWDAASPAMKEAVIVGVKGYIDGTIHSPEDAHESWLREKRADGWTIGPRKDWELKTHPGLVPYDQLPANERSKDILFVAIAKALSPRHALNIPIHDTPLA